MLSIVGLGNPGMSYRNSRHNVGFMVVDGMVEGRFGTAVSCTGTSRQLVQKFLSRKESSAKVTVSYVSLEGELGGKPFSLIKPLTFMNNSGIAVSRLKAKGIIRDLSELLIIVDDVNLDIGRVRLRAGGSAGGHNGLKSIIDHLASEDFTRLRIGVGPRPEGTDLVNYVLGTFRPIEWNILDKSLSDAAVITEAWIQGGYENAQAALSRL